MRDIGGRAASGVARVDAALRHQQIRRDVPDADHAKAVLLEDAADPGQQMIVAAAKRRHDAGRCTRSVPQSSRISDSAGRTSVPMKIRSRQPSLRNSFDRAAELPDRNPVMAEALDRRGIAGAAQREQHRRDAARGSESATANGIAPPPAITPTGDEICGSR